MGSAMYSDLVGFTEEIECFADVNMSIHCGVMVTMRCSCD